MELGSVFGTRAHADASAPGRVNLIGDHTDYSGGFVLPMTIPQRTRTVLAKVEGDVVRIASDAMGETATFRLGDERRRGAWIDYVQGTVVALRARGLTIGGFDAFVSSTVPVGAGLASSAALEISVLRALRQAFELPIDDVEIAHVGRAAETDFVGAPIGIMDQMAASLGDDTSALFLDTRSLTYERVELPGALEVVVIDSGVTHDHATGGYATRRAECDEAAKRLGVTMLRDITDIARAAELPEPLARRARHVVSENARVLSAIECIRAGDATALGRLLDGSHASLRNDFEVSVPEVDALVGYAQADPAALGARMTGGGFGGSIVVLARSGAGSVVATRIVEAHDGKARVLIPEKR